MSERPPHDPGPKPGEETIFVADNVDEFVQRTRWQQILEARETAAQARRDVNKYVAEYYTSHRSRADAKRMAAATVRSAVEAYVLECEPLFQRTEAGRKLWTDTELGSMPLRRLFTPDADVDELCEVEVVGDSSLDVHYPTKTVYEHVGSRPTSIEAAVTHPRATRHVPDEDAPIMVYVTGVRDFVELPNTRVRYEYTADFPHRGNATDRCEGVAELQTPLNLTTEAFRATNALLNHVGPGFEIGSDGEAVEGEYADLLDSFDDE